MLLHIQPTMSEINRGTQAAEIYPSHSVSVSGTYINVRHASCSLIVTDDHVRPKALGARILVLSKLLQNERRSCQTPAMRRMQG